MNIFKKLSDKINSLYAVQNYRKILPYVRPYWIRALLAVLIIMGLWVRMSALVMSLGILLMFAWGGFGAGEPEFAWLGIYVFLIVSGGGLYAFDAALTPSDRKK